MGYRTRDIQVIAIVVIGILLSAGTALAQTWLHWDFEDGKLRGVSTRMAVKATIVHESGNAFMRITKSPGDCASIPAVLCPPKSRSVVRLSTSSAAMPRLSPSVMRQSYSARIRFDNNTGPRGSAIGLFQHGPKLGGYGTRDGNGPVAKIWRKDSLVYFVSLYDNEKKLTEVTRPVTDGAWHTYRIDAVWSHDPAIGRLVYTFDGVTVLTVSGRDVNLGPSSDRIPEHRIGMYGDAIPVGSTMDVDDIQVYSTECDPPARGTSGTGSSCEALPPPIPPPERPKLIADYDLDSTFLDLTALNNDGKAVGVTFDTTQKVQGTGSAVFHAADDRMITPLMGSSLSEGLTIALSARAGTLGTLQYMWGHTSSPPKFTDRIQLKKDALNRFLIGIGSNRDAMITPVTLVSGTWYRFGLVVLPGTRAGSGTFRAYAQGVLVGTGTYTGLAQLGAYAAIGNDGGTNVYGWGTAGDANLDKVRVWNSARTPEDMAEDCRMFCQQER